MSLTIKIKYHSNDIPKLEKIEKGNWIDLRAAHEYELKAGNFELIDFGISMALPEGYEGHLAPRSSTFKNYGILQCNSVGVIDESYRGNNDIWKMPVYATRNTLIEKGDRVAQFRIIEKMPPIEFEEVEDLQTEDRGGFGSTGIK